MIKIVCLVIFFVDFEEVLGTLERLFPSDPHLQELSREKVSGKETSTGQRFLGYRRICTRSWAFLSKKVIFFSEKVISYDFCYFLCFVQEEGDLWRFHLEACTSYTCKGILGLCHSDGS